MSRGLSKHNGGRGGLATHTGTVPPLTLLSHTMGLGVGTGSDTGNVALFEKRMVKKLVGSALFG